MERREPRGTRNIFDPHCKFHTSGNSRLSFDSCGDVADAAVLFPSAWYLLVGSDSFKSLVTRHLPFTGQCENARGQTSDAQTLMEDGSRTNEELMDGGLTLS